MSARIRCDGPLCEETHPLDHENCGEPGFAGGRWLGWIYVDLNRPDMIQRDLRFCGPACLAAWIDYLSDRKYTARLDAMLGKLDREARERRNLHVVLGQQETPNL